MSYSMGISTNAKFKEWLTITEIVSHLDKAIKFLLKNEKRINATFINWSRIDRYDSFHNWPTWLKLREFGLEVGEDETKISPRYSLDNFGLSMYFLYSLAPLFQGSCYFNERGDYHSELYTRYEVVIDEEKVIVRKYSHEEGV
ncbi:MAG: hypothetical protein EP326_08120 [Deltaproteobacteria bacterium]|nr:MAG: hypothetical protein EP326_08120 [Deltaproteobacteria bacterium]